MLDWAMWYAGRLNPWRELTADGQVLRTLGIDADVRRALVAILKIDRGREV